MRQRLEPRARARRLPVRGDHDATVARRAACSAGAVSADRIESARGDGKRRRSARRELGTRCADLAAAGRLGGGSVPGRSGDDRVRCSPVHRHVAHNRLVSCAPQHPWGSHVGPQGRSRRWFAARRCRFQKCPGDLADCDVPGSADRGSALHSESRPHRSNQSGATHRPGDDVPAIAGAERLRPRAVPGVLRTGRRRAQCDSRCHERDRVVRSGSCRRRIGHQRVG